ncbi:DUF4214 domain-containing protein [Massilia arenae]|uniref:DUF4214 domain-containing protein n=1 Tax=Massilia arenae TaxID=2603288 RepID=A0A5C7G4K1_9BURK|nr:DUF4214 domain-containing protein [Massilia arenae]TXG00429.1 DUF4214 domain-containing protein [Massilia arenae]
MKAFAALILVAALVSACGGESDSSPVPISNTLAKSVMSAQRSEVTALQENTEHFSGTRNDYTVSTVNDITTVISKQTALGAPLPSGTRRLKFSDGTLVIDINGPGGAVYRVYQAAFDRKPDDSGYAYWLSVADGGTPIETIATGFVDSNEFRNLYGDKPSNEELLNRYYHNVLHRAPDPDGHAFWLRALNAGSITPAAVLAQFSDSAENREQVLPHIRNGIWIPGEGKLSARLGNESSSLVVGKAELLKINGVSSAGATLQIGDVRVPTVIVDGMLVFAVPELPAGDTTMKVTAQGQSTSLPVTIVQTVLPQQPAAFINSFVQELDDEIAAELPTATGERRLSLERVRSELQKQKTAISTMSATDLHRAALAIAANLGTTGTAASMSARRAAMFSLSECQKSVIQALTFGSPTYLAIAAFGVGTAHGNLVVVAASAAVFIKTKDRTIGLASEAYTTCTEQAFSNLTSDAPIASTISLSSMSVTRASVDSSATPDFSFTDKKARSYSVIERESIHPAAETLRERMQEAATLLSTARAVAQLIGIDLTPHVGAFHDMARKRTGAHTGKTLPGEASNYRLGTISDSRIEGSATGSGDKLVLSFRFKDGMASIDPVGFSFTLINNENGERVASYSGSLKPTPPGYVDAIFELTRTTYSVTNTGPRQALVCPTLDPVNRISTQRMRLTFDPQNRQGTAYFPDRTTTVALTPSGAIQVPGVPQTHIEGGEEHSVQWLIIAFIDPYSGRLRGTLGWILAKNKVDDPLTIMCENSWTFWGDKVADVN